MRGLKIAICVVVFFAALGLTLYPFISNSYAEKHLSTAMAAYTDTVSSMDNTVLETAIQEAERHNQSIGVVPMDGPDAIMRLNSIPPGYSGYLNAGSDGVMGYLRIPAIDLVLPIYHGVSGEVLEKGAGHLPDSSLPVGGSSTHAVLAAHSGLASQRLFTDLEQVGMGDQFFLSIMGTDLAYQVDQILVVDPNDASALAIVPGQDYVTLMTCTPYGTNTHRLLVRGRRIPYTEEVVEEAETVAVAAKAESTWQAEYKKGIMLGLGVLAEAIVIPVLIWQIHQHRRPRRKYRHEK